MAVVDGRWPAGVRASRRQPAGDRRPEPAVRSVPALARCRFRRVAGAAARSPRRTTAKRIRACRLTAPRSRSFPSVIPKTTSTCGGCRCRRRRLRNRFRSARVRPSPCPRPCPAVGENGRPLRAIRMTRVRGHEAYPSWAPDNTRVAFYAVREGIGSVWVATAEPPRPEGDEEPLPRAEAGRATATGVAQGRRAGVVAGRQSAARIGPAGSATGLQRQPASQRSGSAAALRVECRVPVVARGRAAAGARRWRRRGRPRSRRRRRCSARCSIACGPRLKSLYYSAGDTRASSGRPRATSIAAAPSRRRTKPTWRR